MGKNVQSISLLEALLLLPQFLLLEFSWLRILSADYIAPVIVTLAVAWGWFNYIGKSQQRVRQILTELERLVEEFGTTCFQQGRDSEHSQIITLLGKASFGASPSTTPQLATETISKIKRVYSALQLWYFSLLHKVRVMLRRAGTLIEYDLIDVANDFIDIYNSYVEQVAEETLNLASKGELAEPPEPRKILKTFTINLSELRGKVNAFLSSLRDEGYTTSSLEVKAFKQDLDSDQNHGSEEAGLEGQGTTASKLGTA